MRACRGSNRARAVAAIAALIAAGALGLASGCSRERLPEHGTPDARLYVERCGSCHIAYDPRALTASMWEFQVKAMDRRIAEARVRPLTPEERAAILDYLSRNAGGR
jgi:hypothetical protein